VAMLKEGADVAFEQDGKEVKGKLLRKKTTEDGVCAWEAKAIEGGEVHVIAQVSQN
jgi:hypothetical protein